jgi:O-antigen/teichoic acid export membrane protein
MALNIAKLAAGESRYRRNILRIISGTVASQAIVLAATPVLTRLYAPEDFGALAVFTAIQVIAACIFTFKFELAIILPPEPRKAFDLTVLTVGVAFLLSVVFLVALLADFFVSGPGFPWPFLLLPLGTVLAAVNTSAQQWAARAGDYRRYARGQIMNSVFSVGTAFVLAFAVAGMTGALIVGYVIGLAFAAVYLAYSELRNHSDAVGGHIPSPGILIATAREYRHFPVFVLPSSLLGILAVSAQPFLLQTIFSLHDVGLYAIASRFLLVPGAFVGGAVSEAFRSELVDRLRRGLPATQFFERTAARLISFALPVFLVFFIVAPPAFAAIFGEDYRESGVLARYLCLGALAQFAAQPFGYVFVATGRVRLGLLIQTLVTVLPLAGLVVGGIGVHMRGALLTWSVVTFGCSMLLIWLAHRACRANDRLAAAGSPA